MLIYVHALFGFSSWLIKLSPGFKDLERMSLAYFIVLAGEMWLGRGRGGGHFQASMIAKDFKKKYREREEKQDSFPNMNLS